MKNQSSTKRALFSSVLSLILTITMLMATTFAWFTSSVVSSGNIIKTGNLELELWKNSNDNVESWVKIDDNQPVFSYDLWEPGYTAVTKLQVRNVGNLALKYEMFIVWETEPTAATNGIENAFDVVVNDTEVGTLAEVIDGGIAIASNNCLLPASEGQGVNIDDVKIEIAMQENGDTDNNYKDVTLPMFSVQVKATQTAYEQDDYGNEEYDKYASLPKVTVSNATDLKNALTAPENSLIVLDEGDYQNMGDVTLKGDVVISTNGEITLNNKIVVPADTSLTLYNAEINFNITNILPRVIDAKGSGEVTIENSIITSNYDNSMGLICSQSKVTVKNSHITMQEQPIKSSGTFIRQATEIEFTGNTVDMYCTDNVINTTALTKCVISDNIFNVLNNNSAGYPVLLITGNKIEITNNSFTSVSPDTTGIVIGYRYGIGTLVNEANITNNTFVGFNTIIVLDSRESTPLPTANFTIAGNRFNSCAVLNRLFTDDSTPAVSADSGKIPVFDIRGNFWVDNANTPDESQLRTNVDGVNGKDYFTYQ